MEWSDQKPADVINVNVYAGTSGEFTLYEDENTNYNYEKGAYSTIKFNYDDAKKKLTISERKGEFPGMLKSRTFNIILHTPGMTTATLNPDDTSNAKVVRYTERRSPLNCNRTVEDSAGRTYTPNRGAYKVLSA